MMPETKEDKILTFVTPKYMDYDVGKEIDKLAKKFGKSYNILIEWNKVPTEMKILANGNSDPNNTTDICGNRWRKIPAWEYTIKLLVPVIKHDGYEYVATLKKESVGADLNQVFAVKKYENEDFSKYFKGNFWCDHCNTDRYRKIVHLFRKGKKDKMIASSCSKEYFGIDIGKKLWKLLKYFEKESDGFFEDGEMGFGRCFRVPTPFDSFSYMRIAYGIIKKDGGYRKADYDQSGTSSDATHYYYPLHDPRATYTERQEHEENRKEFMSASDHIEDMQTVVDYWLAKDASNNFVHNIQTALQMINPQKGLLAWAIFDYMKNVEKFGEIKTKVKSNGKHYGKVGDKIEKKVTVTFTYVIETRGFGYNAYPSESQIVSMIDEEGYVFTWFNNSPERFTKGDEITIKAKIKNHKEYKGNPQTLVNYCKVV